MSRGVRQVARKLASLSFTDWVELVQAQAALIAAQALVWTRPVGQLLDGARPAAPPRRATLAEGDPAAPRLARAVSRAATHGIFRPLCLVRAVALQRILERRGIAGSRIRIGVRRNGTDLAAHAWVEYGPQVLGDTVEHVGTFAHLADVQLVDRL